MFPVKCGKSTKNYCISILIISPEIFIQQPKAVIKKNFVHELSVEAGSSAD